jgi:2-methylcitrate dehydratase PrpD
MNNPSAELARFAAELSYDDIPAPVLRRTEDLLLDTLASVLAGSTARPIQAMSHFADVMGPSHGPSELIASHRSSSPYFAALVNAASAHMVEQDDVHNGAVFHPAAVVFPPAIATAQALGRSGKDLLLASIIGYEIGIRTGEFLGRSHYKVFHTTGTAGTIAASVAVGRLLQLDAVQMQHAIGSAGTQAAGLWEFLRDGADSKQLHTAKAAANGLTAAYLAHDGFTGAKRILEGPQGMASGMSTDADPAKLTDRLGSRWAVLETSFKFHASCRHTHPAADALLKVIKEHELAFDDIQSVVAHVHQGAIDVLGPVVNPKTVHQSKFSMGTVLGLIALHRRAGLPEFDAAINDPAVADFRSCVSMQLDPEVDAAYPAQWIGKVTVHTRAGQTFDGRVDEPRGDPGNTLTRSELEDKAKRLGSYRNAATQQEIQKLITKVWNMADTEMVGRFLE